MSDPQYQEQVLKVSSTGENPVVLNLEASTPVTVRLQLDVDCTCGTGSSNRPGSYVDSDLGIR